MEIRQEILVAGALLGIAGVVADIVVVAGGREVDIAVGADLIGDDMPDPTLCRTTAIERRDMSGMRHTIGTRREIGDRMTRLHTGWLAALRTRIVGLPVAGRVGRERQAR